MSRRLVSRTDRAGQAGVRPNTTRWKRGCIANAFFVVTEAVLGTRNAASWCATGWTEFGNRPVVARNNGMRKQYLLPFLSIRSLSCNECLSTTGSTHAMNGSMLNTSGASWTCSKIAKSLNDFS